MATLRRSMIVEIAHARPVEKHMRGANASFFGRDVFGIDVMRERLPKDIFQSLERTIRKGERLSSEIANIVANAMKDWAMSRGATHYSHWFQPMNGLSAEKHDAFLTPTADGHVIHEFSGKMLILGEPDASSFPSGGLRSTFEARGYTAWDPTVPAFVFAGPMGSTLHIPTVYYSHSGAALDRKIPLMRSCQAVSKQALRILRLFGNEQASRVIPMVGAEQEYFLVDKRLAVLRPDIMLTGRTLIGRISPKGQQLEDHYFGAIPERVLAYMQDVENTLFALGIPTKTRHNEAAPGQFELAPLYEEANIAADHNMLIMNVLRLTAAAHDFVCLLHEKPFAGVNGSGKHNNWSIADSEGNNLLNPGDTPQDNAQFLVFLLAVLRAVHKYPEVIRLSTAGAGNDHRLGSGEAPPAIVSVCLGEQLMNVLETLISGKNSDNGKINSLEIGISSLPPLPIDFSDRNRTSPFAFTGNKFEFRTVGSSQTISAANIVINTVVACALEDIANMLEVRIGEGFSLHDALQELLPVLFREHMPIVFNGNGYSPSWPIEAEKRGLPNYANSVDSLAHYTDPEVMDAFFRQNVLTEKELRSHQRIYLNTYTKTLEVEGRVMVDLLATSVLPLAYESLRNAADTVRKIRSIIPVEEEETLPEESRFLHIRAEVQELEKSLYILKESVQEMTSSHENVEELPEAIWVRDNVIPAMEECRKHADALEGVISDSKWLLPKYAELLWMH